uniref:Plexin domain-containing protein 2 n=1 Tax=Timema douglasi TaxID=61478 RepID=A0A7R8VB91_TIMDO|nr:unnamed protein product [Timema douglasi]
MAFNVRCFRRNYSLLFIILISLVRRTYSEDDLYYHYECVQPDDENKPTLENTLLNVPTLKFISKRSVDPENSTSLSDKHVNINSSNLNSDIIVPFMSNLSSPHVTVNESTSSPNKTSILLDANVTVQSSENLSNMTETSIDTMSSPNLNLQNMTLNSSESRNNVSLASDKISIINTNITATIPLLQKNDSIVDEEDSKDLLDRFMENVNNNTLSQNNITKTEEDHHQYYNSSFLVSQAVGEMYWVNMTNRNDVHVNDMLSTSYRRAVTVKLSFDFPFYGHLVRNITVATGGFLYTGEYVHSWLAATQYIAPLMANFDTSISNHSFIKYVDNGTSFTVEWEKVKLQDDTTSGDFTFQVTLHNNGDIVFVYQSVPVIIENILDRHHPVKVGLSDAYIIDRTIFFVRHKTIYEYHRVNFEKQDIKNWTVIYISALRTCLDEKNCSDCLTQFSSFKCYWCPHANRCSNGLDRLRQDWLTRGCDTSALDTSEQCPAIEEINKSVNAGHTRSPQHVIVKPSQHVEMETRRSSLHCCHHSHVSKQSSDMPL